MAILNSAVNTVLTKKPIKLKAFAVNENSKTPMTERERRLQQALRDNLRKRKAQARESKVEIPPKDEA